MNYKLLTLEYPKSQILTSGLGFESKRVFSSLISLLIIFYKNKNNRCIMYCYLCTYRHYFLINILAKLVTNDFNGTVFLTLKIHKGLK